VFVPIITFVASLDELSLSLRLFFRAYRWRKIDPIPWTPMPKALHEAKLALVTTAGMVQPGQPDFDEAVRGGDYSFREIADDADVSLLNESHRSEAFDHAGVRSDPNLAFPLDRLHELVRDGQIGSANHRHLSFMGSITAPGRLVAQTAPQAAQILVDDRVDAVLLLPV
jgi:D-proline reductase (dithiol) PrdB